MPKPGKGSSEERHTLMCGFSGSPHQTSEPLQLHLTDCTIRASNQLGFLMQQNDHLLMLDAGSSHVQRLAVITSGAGETKDACAFGSVSGTAYDFVASYGKNSLSSLSLSVSVCLPVCLPPSPSLSPDSTQGCKKQKSVDSCLSN